MVKNRKSERLWLNSDPESTAFVCWRANKHDYSLKLSDCSRTITLDFGLDKDYQPGQKSLTKLNRLIDSLCRFREALVLAGAK